MRLHRPLLLLATLGTVGILASACQNYAFDYQAQQNHQATHLHFEVAQPSLADLLFVVDNSGSMLNKQAQLAQAVNQLLDTLAPQDTHYRIGITSTDAHGFLQDCNDAPNPVVASNTLSDARMGAKGNYCDANGLLQTQALRRPHDATLGRLIAAYDAASFGVSQYGLANNSQAQNALIQLMPTAVDTSPNPNLLIGEPGARWVIDRDVFRAEACNACMCDSCTSGELCYDTCAQPVTRARVQAQFLANIRGLGNRGFAWEAGLKSAMWAVGIDPEQGDDEDALDPAYNLLAEAGPNTFMGLSGTGAVQQAGWLRPDAVLAVLFLTDEQDCSMPEDLVDVRAAYEDNPPPHGSICYQAEAQAAFHDPNRLADLLVRSKGGDAAQVAVGLIGGVTPTDGAATLDAGATASDCTLTDGAVANQDCACNAILSREEGTGVDNDLAWCAYTQNHQTSGLPGCDGMSASRYLTFANSFGRRTFESICRNDQSSFGPALAAFARLATQACFVLNGVQPAQQDPHYVTVTRTPKGSTQPSVQLVPQPADSEAMGFYYDAVRNQVCLTGLNRIVGDVYDIFIEEADSASYTP